MCGQQLLAYHVIQINVSAEKQIIEFLIKMPCFMWLVIEQDV